MDGGFIEKVSKHDLSSEGHFISDEFIPLPMEQHDYYKLKQPVSCIFYFVCMLPSYHWGPLQLAPPIK